jgi:DNA-binding winged helix-turn-helix (wHTH) protein
MLVHGCDGASPPKNSGPECPLPVLLFGLFRLDIAGRLLERNGIPIGIGARAFDILVALAMHAGQTMRHDELMTLVWPKLTVTPVSLRGNIANLRKVLGDRRCGARYIINNTGRGYCFVAPVAYAKTRDTTGFLASYRPLDHNNAPSDRATEATSRSRSSTGGRAADAGVWKRSCRSSPRRMSLVRQSGA